MAEWSKPARFFNCRYSDLKCFCFTLESFFLHAAPAGREILRQSTVILDRLASLDRLTSLTLLVTFPRKTLFDDGCYLLERFDGEVLAGVAGFSSRQAYSQNNTYFLLFAGVQWNPPPPPSPSPKLPDAFDARNYWNGTSGTVAESIFLFRSFLSLPLTIC